MTKIVNIKVSIAQSIQCSALWFLFTASRCLNT